MRSRSDRDREVELSWAHTVTLKHADINFRVTDSVASDFRHSNFLVLMRWVGLVIGAFGDYRVIGHVCLSVCPSIFYETASGRKVKFCGLTIFVY